MALCAGNQLKNVMDSLNKGTVMWNAWPSHEVIMLIDWQLVSQIKKNIYKLILSFKVVSDVYKSFIPNVTAFTKCYLTKCISKLPGSFEIH